VSIELLTKAGREKGIVNSLEPLESRANPYRLSTHTTPPNLLVSHGFYLSGSQNLQIRLKFAKMNTKESSGTTHGRDFPHYTDAKNNTRVGRRSIETVFLANLGTFAFVPVF
jgi:hypothetical protein